MHSVGIIILIRIRIDFNLMTLSKREFYNGKNNTNKDMNRFTNKDMKRKSYCYIFKFSHSLT